VTVRAQFINSGRLSNAQDQNFRAIQDNWPVFALAHDLGSISGETPPLVYCIGHVRDPAVDYVVAGGGAEARSIYFWSQFSSTNALVRLP
jgi:hypothetical protein